ncbi:hypothetical protein RHSIM_Rhsim08G0079300 [Rhododendron simsii]|uniref:MI domain-containing protein n=1 Tax=Rhododendron simsii TaxID=118357 RepID=A0A834LGM7_RHOSS|nr:hypothetical protein RHSIM_Rhsim08G0079300 [Rhododendron simsii]
MAVDEKVGEKVRRDRRKEARLLKKKKKFDSWTEHQLHRKLKKCSSDSNPVDGMKSKDPSIQSLKKRELLRTDLDSESDHSSEQPTKSKKSEIRLDSSRFPKSTASKAIEGEKGLKKSKSKFNDYLKMEMQHSGIPAKDDFEMERKLAKKLKVKDGKLGGAADDMNMLFEGIPSVIDFFEEEQSPVPKEIVKKRSENSSSSKKRKKRESFEKQLEGGSDMAAETMVGVFKPVQNGYDVDQSMQQASKPKEFTTKLDCPKSSDSAAVKEVKRKKKKMSEREPAAEVAGATAVVVSEPVETFRAEVTPGNVPAKTPELDANVKYVAPHLRSRTRNESEEYSQIRRRVRGLLNRLSESNVESTTGEMSTIFRNVKEMRSSWICLPDVVVNTTAATATSVARSVGSQIITEEVLASCSGGPRGNEQLRLQYAAVFAAFVAGMASLVGIDFGAKLLASLAKCFEDEYLEEDNLSLRNLTLLLSYLYIFGVCSSDLIYDFMIMLSKRLREIDVSTILTILQCCGMNLRGEDHAAMKSFVLSVQNRANELKASSGNGLHSSSKRMEFMLETISDIKNNKKRAKEDTPQHTRMKKWLQKLRVEGILIRGLKWSKLLDPDKKGQWWLSGDVVPLISNVEEVASTIEKESLEAQKLLQLASAQRMNTDVRRAIFCVIMSGEDYIDAFEKLLRLNLQGKQDREIMRVLVECCLQEQVYNKYYSVLATRLCSHDNNHKATLKVLLFLNLDLFRSCGKEGHLYWTLVLPVISCSFPTMYCLWDHFKELESMELKRSMRLSKFAADMFVSFTLSLAVLKAVDFTDTTQMIPKRIKHFQMLFEAIFEHPDSLVWNVFTRIAANPECESLRQGIEFFINKYVVSSRNSLANKSKIVKKALASVDGALMDVR